VPGERDVDPWTELLTDPVVTRYLGSRAESRDEVAAHVETVLERHAADGFGLLSVVRKEDARVIGRAGFLVWDTRTWSITTLREAGAHGRVEIGWALAPDCWGSGYATEAGRACRDHAFEVLGFDRLASIIKHGNDPSVAVARRLGMAHERDIRTARGYDAQLWAIRR
jgi:RimJ/RimL family protein N-acetyltransferase